MVMSFTLTLGILLSPYFAGGAVIRRPDNIDDKRLAEPARATARAVVRRGGDPLRLAP
jgi:hypothetical protein